MSSSITVLDVFRLKSVWHLLLSLRETQKEARSLVGASPKDVWMPRYLLS